MVLDLGELIEVIPDAIRLKKKILNEQDRIKHIGICTERLGDGCCQPGDNDSVLCHELLAWYTITGRFIWESLGICLLVKGKLLWLQRLFQRLSRPCDYNAAG